MSDEIVIHGQESIQAFFQKRIDKLWKQLDKRHSNSKGKILFALLLIINDISKSIYDGGEIEVDDYLRLPIQLLVFDELLARDWNQIEPPSPDEIQRYVDFVVKEFQEIGLLKNRMIASEAVMEEHISIKKGERVWETPFQSESAFDDWINRYSFDGDWIEYYHNKSMISPELTESFRMEFSKRYGITPQQLHRFEGALAKFARKELRGEGFPFLNFSHEDLLSMMQKSMAEVEPVDNDKVAAFLQELEYNPDRHWSRSPFLKVTYRNNALYALLLPAIHSLKLLSGAWLEAVLEGSRTIGRRNKDYGRHFEEYVRNLLRTHHPHLLVNRGSLRIRRNRFPEVANCVGTSEIEIDAVAQSDTHVYLLSCKAMDQSLGPKLLLSYFLWNYKTFFGSVEWDLEKAHEISDWADCIRKSPRVLEDRGFTEREIVPLLVTSDSRPLSLESIQKWCLDMELASTLPEAMIIQANALKDFTFN